MLKIGGLNSLVQRSAALCQVSYVPSSTSALHGTFYTAASGPAGSIAAVGSSRSLSTLQGTSHGNSGADARSNLRAHPAMLASLGALGLMLAAGPAAAAEEPIQKQPRDSAHEQRPTQSKWCPYCMFIAHARSAHGHVHGGAGQAAATAAAAPSNVDAPAAAAATAAAEEQRRAADAATAAAFASQPHAALACMLAAPTAVLLGGCQPLGPHSLAALAHSFADLLAPSASAAPAAGEALPWWQLAAAARALAMLLGPQLPQACAPAAQLLRAATDAGLSGSSSIISGGGAGGAKLAGAASAFDVASLCWATAVVEGGFNEQDVSRFLSVLARAPGKQLDEPTLLLALLTLTAAAAAVPGGAETGSIGASPRPSRQAVDGLIKRCGGWMFPGVLHQRLMQVYDEYVPLHPYVEGALLPVLHAAAAVPHLAAAASAAAAPGGTPSGTPSGGASSDPLRQLGGALPWGAPGAAAALLAAAGGAGSGGAGGVSKELARLKRDLFFHWRQDELVDSRQRALNEVAHMLSRRLQLPIAQPPDADILLPTRSTVITIDDDTAPAALTTPPAPFYSPQAAADALARLVREGWAPSTSLSRQACTGLQAARESAMRAHGWTSLHIPLSRWQALGGSTAPAAPAAAAGARLPPSEAAAAIAAAAAAKIAAAAQGEGAKLAFLEALVQQQ